MQKEFPSRLVIRILACFIPLQFNVALGVKTTFLPQHSSAAQVGRKEVGETGDEPRYK